MGEGQLTRANFDHGGLSGSTSSRSSSRCCSGVGRGMTAGGSAASAERHDRQRGGFRDRAGGGYLHIVLAQPVGEARAERVSGKPAEEPCRLAEPGHRPGGIERTAARTGVNAAVRPDDQIHQALAGDQDHEAVPGPVPVLSVRSAPALLSPALPPPPLVAGLLLSSAAPLRVVAPVMMATASSIVWLCGVMTPAERPTRWMSI